MSRASGTDAQEGEPVTAKDPDAGRRTDATAQQRLAHVIRTQLHPALRAAGFSRSQHTWRRGTDDDGWICLQVQGSRHSTSTEVELTVNTFVWPPGTWPQHCALTGDDVATRPWVAFNAPVCARPREVAPELAPAGDWWVLDAGADLDRWGQDLTAFVADSALPWALRLLDPDTAVDRLLREAHAGALTHALAVLTVVRRRQAAAESHAEPAPASARTRARFAAVVEQLTATWVADPRPITLRPHVAAWRRAAGLPEVDLPTVWSPSMLPETVARFGSAEAARAAGIGTIMHSWDGRSWEDRPAH
jgi:hypothetical protein